MKSLKLSTKLSLLVLVSVLGLVLFGLAFQSTFNTLAIRSPLYDRIIDGKDLIADILPLPVYIIESYVTVLEASATRAIPPSWTPSKTAFAD